MASESYHQAEETGKSRITLKNELGLK
ncbi:uncharacterized protein G2W53_041059 [Senna tora]|uniref:Uncharacterized protein n=1 Tax=Senna tora TaxID=362788 RepID=A0A834VXP1_9FABA|nr:uncharacterized protein G2W53_041059 [Senna tora]